jgi:hypothetical protein
MSKPGQGDFDFLRGRWRVRHRRLVARLVNSSDWQEFDGTMTLQPVLGGQGNVDDNVLDLPGGAYRAVTVRAFDPDTGQWAIWWLDSRYPDTLGTPVVGSFENGVGTFYADETMNGRPVRTRFLWTDIATPSPHWEQAASVDGGKTWETNWKMRFIREEV